MDIRHFVVICVAAVFSGCSSANLEAIKQKGIIDIPVVETAVETPQTDTDQLTADGVKMERLNAAWCYAKWRGSRLSQMGYAVRAEMPEFDLDSLRFIQPNVTVKFVRDFGSAKEKRAIFDERDHGFAFGPLIGRFVISFPNDEALNLLSDISERVSEHGFKWTWRRIGGHVWTSNLFGVVFTRQGESIALNMSLANSYIIGGSIPAENLFSIDAFSFDLWLNLDGLAQKIFASFLKGHYKGVIKFAPVSVGLMKDGKLKSCVHIGKYPASGKPEDAWKD